MAAYRLLKTVVNTVSYIQEKGSHPLNYNHGRNSLKLNDVLQKRYIVTCDFSRTTCGYCLEQNPAIAYCKDCDCFIDPLCVTYHNKIKTILTHEVAQLYGKNEKEIKYQDLAKRAFCDKKNHEHFEYDSYCVSCKDLVCRECRKKHLNHDLNLLQDFYSLLNLIVDIKRTIDAIIQLHPRDERNNEFNTISATARIIDSIIKFQKDLSGDALVRIMFKDLRVDEYKMLPVQDVYNKLKTINGYLQQRLSEVSDNRASVTRNEMDEDEQTDEGSIVSNERVANSAEQFGPMTMEYLSSFPSDKLFPSISQPEDHSGPYHQKPPEHDIAALHQDMDNSFHLESFQDLHPHT